MYTIFVNETKVMIYFQTEDTLTGNIIEKNNTVDAQNSKSASRKQYVMNNFENIKKPSFSVKISVAQESHRSVKV